MARKVFSVGSLMDLNTTLAIKCQLQYKILSKLQGLLGWYKTIKPQFVHLYGK